MQRCQHAVLLAPRAIARQIPMAYAIATRTRQRAPVSPPSRSVLLVQKEHVRPQIGLNAFEKTAIFLPAQNALRMLALQPWLLLLQGLANATT